MSQLAETQQDTLADAIHALGDVPLHRVLYYKLGSATEKDAWRFWDKKIRAELVDGIFVVKAIERNLLREMLDQFVPGTETLADVIDRIGNVPLDRVLWNPLPGTATEADALRLLDGEPKRLVELVDGILVEKPMGQREGFLAASLITFLMIHVRANRLGVVGAPDTALRFTSGKLWLPDVCFTAWENLPDRESHLQRVGKYAPDLAVEILSESNSKTEIQRKRREYFAAGTKLVWIVDPVAETFAVYTSVNKHTLLTRSDTLDGGDVLPDFRLPLEELFDDPQLNPRPEEH